MCCLGEGQKCGEYDKRREPAKHGIRQIVASEGYSEGGNEDRNDRDRWRKSGAGGLRDDEDQAEQPAGGCRFTGDEGTVADAFSGKGTGMNEIKHAAEEVCLPWPWTARERLEPEIDDQHGAEKQRSERNSQIAVPQRLEGCAVLLPALDQHPTEAGGNDIGKLKEYLPEETHMRIVAIGENATDLGGFDRDETLLRQKEHMGDGEINLWKNRKQPEQYPPQAEESDECIARRARSQDLGEAVLTIEGVEINDQSRVPVNDDAGQAAAQKARFERLATIDDKDLKAAKAPHFAEYLAKSLYSMGKA